MKLSIKPLQCTATICRLRLLFGFSILPGVYRLGIGAGMQLGKGLKFYCQGQRKRVLMHNNFNQSNKEVDSGEIIVLVYTTQAE